MRDRRAYLKLGEIEKAILKDNRVDGTPRGYRREGCRKEVVMANLQPVKGLRVEELML